MTHEQLNAIRTALAVLIDRPEYDLLKADIEALAQTRYGALAGDLALLNPLVDLAREKGVERLNALWALGDRKRDSSVVWERQLISGPTEDAPVKDTKTEYQRTYMAQRRKRFTKAAKLWYRLTGERLIGEDQGRRRAFEGEIQALWMLRRDEVLGSHGPLEAAEKLELTRLFWEEVDSQLDRGLAGDEAIGRHVLGLAPKD